VSGWAIDKNSMSGTGIDAIHVYATRTGGSSQFLGAATYGLARTDVGNAFGAAFTPSGFALDVTLTTGTYQIVAYGHSTVTGGFTVASMANVTVSGPIPQPWMSLDNPVTNGTSRTSVRVEGWAIDLGAASGTGVSTIHVWAAPAGGGAGIFLGAATYGIARPDVGTAFGSSRFTNSGYSLLATLSPGTYTITAYMLSTVTGTFNRQASASNVKVSDSNAQLAIDSPANGSTRLRPFSIAGWAADTGAATGTGIDTIHIWAFPVGGGPQFFLGAATYGLSRPDVGAFLGNSRFNNSGYALTVSSSNMPSPGTYDLQVYGRSTVTGSFSVMRVVRVIVQ